MIAEPAREIRSPTDGAPDRGPRSPFLRGYVVAAIPSTLLFLPLLAHRSADPVLLTFSTSYVAFLAVVASVAMTSPAHSQVLLAPRVLNIEPGQITSTGLWVVDQLGLPEYFAMEAYVIQRD